jgi:hypothetical protein
MQFEGTGRGGSPAKKMNRAAGPKSLLIGLEERKIRSGVVEWKRPGREDHQARKDKTILQFLLENPSSSTGSRFLSGSGARTCL